MIKSIFFTSLLLLGGTISQAQSYQWVKGGGSTSNIQNKEEQTTFLCTDPNRNVYSLNAVGDINITADTFHRPLAYNTGGSNPLEHTLFCSYRCDGTMRWAKLLESYGYATSYGLQYDGAGNIYIVMTLPNINKHIGDDSFSNSINLSSCLIKYDTSGDFKWVRFVGADNATTGANTGFKSALAIDNQGNPHHFNYVRNGVQLMPAVISQTGTYDLKYDAQGNLLSAIRLQGMDSSYYATRVALAPSGKIFASMSTQSGTLPPVLLSGFSNTGTRLWSDTTNYFGFVTNPIFHGGALYANFFSSGEAFTIKGQTFSNAYGSINALGGIMKLDTLGNLKWLYKLESTLSVVSPEAMTLLQGNKLAVTGAFAGKIRHLTDSMTSTAGQNPFLLITDTAGNTIKLDQPIAPGFYDLGTAIAADNTGNVMIGGMVESTITAGTLTPYTNIGGSSDFFIMKYGYACNCTPPLANYNKTINNATRTATLTYTGTGTADSVRWAFGDGQFVTKSGSGITTAFTHTYTTGGTYTICATAYNSCGNNQSCQQVAVSVGIAHTSGLEGIKVYPNPANDHITIEGAAGTTVTLLSIVGQQVFSTNVGDNKQILSLQAVPAGTYILSIQGKDGAKGSMRITKQ